MTAHRIGFTGMIALAFLVLPAWADAAESEILQRNKVELFLGNTKNGSSNGASFGLSYARRLSPLFALGGYIEHAAGDFDTSAVGIDFKFHPHAGWIFKISPGLEFDDGGTKVQGRLGVGYEFEITSEWSLAPEVNVEFVDGEKNLVYGVLLGYGF